VVNGSMKLSAPIVQSNASMFIMVGRAGRGAQCHPKQQQQQHQQPRGGNGGVSVGFEWM